MDPLEPISTERGLGRVEGKIDLILDRIVGFERTIGSRHTALEKRVARLERGALIAASIAAVIFYTTHPGDVIALLTKLIK